MNKYSFIILGSDNEIFLTSFEDALSENIIYERSLFKKCGPLLSFFKRVHLSKEANRFFSLPLKKIWLNGNLVKHKTNKICFILFSNWIRLDEELNIISFLRKKYIGCKIVWFAQDILKTLTDYYTGKKLNIKGLKRKLDLIVSYDMSDVKKYELTYHPTVLSKINVPKDNHFPFYDVFFLGKDKGRLGVLKKLCEKLNGLGLKCGFYVIGVSQKDRAEIPGMYYIDKPFTYAENLMMASNSKCLLELMQPDAVGYTFRTNEALVFGKKLITDNSAIKKAPFYNPQNIILLQEIDENIDKLLLLKKPMQTVSYLGADVVSPKHFFEFVETQLG